MQQPSEILDRLPPQDLDTERALLGTALKRPESIDDVAETLSAADFYADAHQKLWACLVAMRDADQPIDLVTVNTALKARGEREAVGGAAYLVECYDAAPHGHNGRYYAGIVRRKAMARRLIEAATDLLSNAHDTTADPETVLESAEAALTAIHLTTADTEPVSIAEAAIQASARIDVIHQRGQGAGLLTGLVTFDDEQGGLFPGELIVLAARPGIGKTSWALQVAAHNAACHRLTYFASLEMSRVELSTRLACSDADVSNRAIRTGRLTDGDIHRLADALAAQGDMWLDVHDRSALTVAEIRRQIRRRVKRGLMLAVVDYLQLITPEDRKTPREQQVARIVRVLKETAVEYQVPILCLCQLNRQAGEDELPRLSHLRESGAIEQDSDVVLFLSRHEPTDAEPHNAVLSVAKNRNGETGHLRLMWDGPRTRFDAVTQPAGYHREFAEFE